MEVLSGVAVNIWGGSDNLVSGRKDQGVIVGDTHVTVGTESGGEAVCQCVYGGGSRSTIGQENVYYDPNDPWASAKVGGNTYVVINATAKGRNNASDSSGGHIYAAGDLDIINGTTSLVLNGGSGFEWVFAGGTNSDYQDETEINNMRGEPNAASIVIYGGT